MRLRMMVAVATAVTAAWGVPTGASLSAVASPAAPHGFQAADYTFVSPSVGWVLGNAPCPRPVCTALLRTEDGGATWMPASPPPIATTYPCAKPCGAHDYAGHVRFADRRDGWVFGNVLLATHDGARTWHAVPGIDAVLDVVTGGGKVIVVRLRTTNGACDVCDVEADEAPAGSDTFHRTGLPRFASGRYGSIAAMGDHIWVVAGGDSLLRSRDSGRHWQSLSIPCHVDVGAWNLRATEGGSIWALCPADPSTGVPPAMLLTSQDGGRQWSQRPIPHGALDLAAATELRGYVITAPDELMTTDDGGRHWRVSLSGTGDIVGVRAQDARHARALGGLDGASGMWRTSDAGRHWSFSSFAP